MSIEFDGYKDSGCVRLLEFLEKNDAKQNVVRLDPPSKVLKH